MSLAGVDLSLDHPNATNGVCMSSWAPSAVFSLFSRPDWSLISSRSPIGTPDPGSQGHDYEPLLQSLLQSLALVPSSGFSEEYCLMGSIEMLTVVPVTP